MAALSCPAWAWRGCAELRLPISIWCGARARKHGMGEKFKIVDSECKLALQRALANAGSRARLAACWKAARLSAR